MARRLWNLNVQLAYWLPLASNHLDLDEPLIHELDRSFDAMLRDACHGASIGNLAWVMHNYWWHYRFAGDPAAIREKWVPKAARLAGCYLQRLVREGDGTLHLPQTESPNTPARLARRASGISMIQLQSRAAALAAQFPARRHGPAGPAGRRLEANARRPDAARHRAGWPHDRA